MEKNVVRIENLDHFGRGIARIDNIPVFIDGVLKEELVEIEIVKQKKNFMEGRAIQILETSPNRIKPKCPYFGICGGCDIMHLDYEHQLFYKQNKVKEIMDKFHIGTKIQPIIRTSPFEYRDKVTLKVNKKVGYFKKKSYDIVPITKCLIAFPSINQVINVLKNQDLSNIKEIMIRSFDKETMIQFKGEKGILCDKVDSIYQNDTKIRGKENIIAKIGDISYLVSPNSFFQVNLEGMEKLYNQVKKYCDLKGNEKVLDLYCGTGTIGLYLSNTCREVLGIEINASAIEDAKKNQKYNHITNARFICGDVGSSIHNLDFQPDVVVVDPPRAGLDRKTVDNLLEWETKKIIYVSCDPMTLGRDLQLLQEKYDIIEITPVDMFPQTYHVECVCLLNLR